MNSVLFFVHKASESSGLPLNPIFFGLIAAVAFFALLLVTLSFSNVSHRHNSKTSTGDAEHGDGHGGHH